MSLWDALKAAESPRASYPPVVNSAELQRILRLPRRKLEPSPALIEALNAEFCLDPGVGLRWIQAEALYEAALCNGLFGSIGVGHGKTLITLLVAEAMESEKAVLLVPAQLRKKTLAEIEEFYSKKFRLPLDRLAIHTYHELSRPETADILDKSGADLVVLDEAHKVANRKSARGKRFNRYLNENPHVRLVCLSGTMTKRSILDYANLMEMALGKLSPLPKGWNELVDWSGALDVDPPEPRSPGALSKFCEPGESVRSAFHRRLSESRGVITTTDSGFEGSIMLRELTLRVPQKVQKLMDIARTEWKIGDIEITEATHLARVLRQLACGFYYRWDWPDGEDREWLDARRCWFQHLREFLKTRARAGQDSPKLIRDAIEAGDITGDIVGAWYGWKAVSDRPEPATVPVWVSPFMLNAVEHWLKKPRGIAWVTHRALLEALKERGLPVYDQGDNAQDATEPSIVCGVRSQSTGKNLQHRYHRNLLTSMISSGDTGEQLLGRTHRPGQEEDTVEVYWYGHTPEMHRALESWIQDAEYVQETKGQQQKILLADRLAAE